MKFVAIALIVALCVLGTMGKPSSISGEYDSLCVGIESGLFPHPDTCNGFIQCSNEIAFEQPCPQGAPCFSPEIQQCTFVDTCSCKEEPTSTEES